MTNIAFAVALLSCLICPVQEDLFDQLDKNADGRIGPGELPLKGGPVYQVLIRRDMNQDGVITRNEFLGRDPAPPIPGPVKTPDKSEPSKPRSTFDRLDIDGDGVLRLTEIPKAQRERFARLFGTRTEVTREEFAKVMPQKPGNSAGEGTLFSILDRDRNGVVTRVEINAAEENSQLMSGSETRAVVAALKKSERNEFNKNELDDYLLPVFFGIQLKRFDRDGDGKIALGEVPARLRPGLSELLERAGRSKTEPLAVETYGKLWANRVRAARSAPVAPPTKLDNVPAAFQVLDENHDGFITADELTDIQARLQLLDIDRDGGLSVAEFIGDLSRMNGGAATPRPQPGAPTPPKPSQPVVKQNSPPRPATTNEENDARDLAKAIFGQFDKDTNNKLGKDEAPSFVMKRFGEMDINGDGAVSRAEMIESLIKARRAKK